MRGKDIGFWVIIGGLAVGAAWLISNAIRTRDTAAPAGLASVGVLSHSGPATMLSWPGKSNDSPSREEPKFRIRVPKLPLPDVAVILSDRSQLKIDGTERSGDEIGIQIRADYPPELPPISVVANQPGGTRSEWLVRLPPPVANVPNPRLTVEKAKVGALTVRGVAAHRPSAVPGLETSINIALKVSGTTQPGWRLLDVETKSLYGPKFPQGRWGFGSVTPNGKPQYSASEEPMPYAPWMSHIRVQGRMIRTVAKEELVDFGEVELAWDPTMPDLLRFRNPEKVTGASNLGLRFLHAPGDYNQYLPYMGSRTHLKVSFRLENPTAGFTVKDASEKPEALLEALQASVQLYVTKRKREEPVYTFMIRRPDLKVGKYRLQIKLRRRVVLESHRFDLRLPVSQLPLRPGLASSGTLYYGSRVDPDLIKLFAK